MGIIERWFGGAQKHDDNGGRTDRRKRRLAAVRSRSMDLDVAVRIGLDVVSADVDQGDAVAASQIDHGIAVAIAVDAVHQIRSVGDMQTVDVALDLQDVAILEVHHHIAAAATGEDERVEAVATEQRVIASAAGERIVAVAADEQILAGTAVKEIAVLTTDQRVIAFFAKQQVEPIVADEGVIALAAKQDVRPVVAENRIITAVTESDPIPVAEMDGIASVLAVINFIRAARNGRHTCTPESV